MTRVDIPIEKRSVSAGRKSPNAPYNEKFFRDRSVVDGNECWIWQRALGPGGYGTIRYQHGNIAAHRLSYMVATGSLPPREVDICHRCDVRRCVNPAHLFPGTRTDNMRDCARKGRIVTPGLAGDLCPNSKLTSEIVRLVRIDPRPASVLGREYGVTKSTINNIRRRKTWRSVA